MHRAVSTADEVAAALQPHIVGTGTGVAASKTAPGTSGDACRGVDVRRIIVDALEEMHYGDLQGKRVEGEVLTEIQRIAAAWRAGQSSA